MIIAWLWLPSWFISSWFIMHELKLACLKFRIHNLVDYGVSSWKWHRIYDAGKRAPFSDEHRKRFKRWSAMWTTMEVAPLATKSCSVFIVFPPPWIPWEDWYPTHKSYMTQILWDFWGWVERINQHWIWVDTVIQSDSTAIDLSDNTCNSIWFEYF